MTDSLDTARMFVTTSRNRLTIAELRDEIGATLRGETFDPFALDGEQ